MQANPANHLKLSSRPASDLFPSASPPPASDTNLMRSWILTSFRLRSERTSSIPHYIHAVPLANLSFAQCTLNYNVYDLYI